MDEIKQMAIASIKDSTRMYYSCDVGKFYNRKTGILSLDNFDYGDLFDTTFPMTRPTASAPSPRLRATP